MSLLFYWMGLKSSQCFFKMPFIGRNFGLGNCANCLASQQGTSYSFMCSTWFVFRSVVHLLISVGWGQENPVFLFIINYILLQEWKLYNQFHTSVPSKHMPTTQKGQPHLLCQGPLPVMTENECANDFKDHREVLWLWWSQSGAELWKYKKCIKDIIFLNVTTEEFFPSFSKMHRIKIFCYFRHGKYLVSSHVI